jgi:uncharacterized damage-inducible protein DinB
MINYLRRGFEYDLWANLQWLECLTRTNSEESDLKIFQHLLASQKAWALRCHGINPSEPPLPELNTETLIEINKMWLDLLDGREIEEFIPYKRYNGDPNSMTISWMAQHVINHGTYHRGELRGLRRMRGDDDFPDTDMAGYAFEAGGAHVG